MPREPSAVRVAHFSDVHLTVRRLGWVLRDLASKRVTGWFHLKGLGRGRRFRHAEAVVAALVHDLKTRAVDVSIFTGDATALGFGAEMAHAAASLHVADAEMPPGVSVPGNHDYYTRPAITSGRFESAFAPWQVGVRFEGHTYPFARRIGHAWFVAVNSSTANSRPWDASGAVGPAQCERLRELLARLDPGPRVLVTHYPVCLADGEPESRWHGLRDLDHVVTIAAGGGVGLWLHGHRHAHYSLARPPQAPFPVICAGSTTQTGRGGYGEYVIAGRRLVGRRRVYDLESGSFHDGERFELELAG